MTTIKYFKGIKTYKDLKEQYRKLARKLHPDMTTGNEKEFIAMKTEYDFLFKNLEKVDTDFEFKTHTNVNYDFKDIIDKIIIEIDNDYFKEMKFIYIDKYKYLLIFL